MLGETTLPVDSDVFSNRVGDGGETNVLTVAWSVEEPWRVGEVVMPPPVGQSAVLGRGEGEPGEARVRFFRQRPGTFTPGPPLAGAGLSRHQLTVTSNGDALSRTSAAASFA